METKKTLRIGGMNLERFNIVYPKGHAVEQFLAEELARMIAETTGKELLAVNDDYVRIEHEIRFGLTNRAAEEDEPVAEDEYVIRVLGKNVDVLAGNVFGFEDALARLESLLAEEGDAEWKSGDAWTGKISHMPTKPEGYNLTILYHNILGYLPWYPALNRAAMGVELYREYMPDIIGQQEVSKFYYHDSIDAVNALLEMGYEEIRFPRMGYGNPIYYNAEKLELLECGYKTVRRGDKGTTWAVLRFKKSGGRIFGVLNSHFAADSNANRDPVLGNEYRTQDAKAAVSVVKMIEQRYPGIPVFTGGDYNAAQGSDPINAIAEGGLTFIRDCLEDQSHCDFHAWNGYPVYDEEKKRYRYEEFHRKGPKGNIDFVTLGGDLNGTKVLDYRILNDRISCTVSDHLPHLCFLYVPRNESYEELPKYEEYVQ